MNIKALGIDLAKNVFQLHGIDLNNKVVIKKRLGRDKFATFMRELQSCNIFMEACGGAHEWARRFSQYGHVVKLISPIHVKKFLKGQKNDKNDARAIVSAGLEPDARFVQIKTLEQQGVQSLLRVREGYMARRIEVSNQIRAILTEYGIIMAQGKSALKQQLHLELDKSTVIPERLKAEILWLWEEWNSLENRINELDKSLRKMAKENDKTDRLMTIPGVGTLSALGLFAAVGDGKAFKNGRHMAAFLGLVPRQHSSGQKMRLGSITKQGNTYLRKTLIQGSKALFLHLCRKPEAPDTWLYQVAERRGQNKAAVAQANKNARIAWALLTKGEVYQVQAVH